MPAVSDTFDSLTHICQSPYEWCVLIMLDLALFGCFSCISVHVTFISSCLLPFPLPCKFLLKFTGTLHGVMNRFKVLHRRERNIIALV